MQTPPAPVFSSPFLPSNASDFPSLKKIRVPIGAVAEFQQQTSCEPIDLPTGKIRESKRTYANKPTSSCPPEFKFAFNAFCTARRAVAACTLDEAEAMVSAETMELLAFTKGESGKNGSIPPRSLTVALVIPKESVNNSNVVPFVDGFAALSDLKIDGVPLATKVRFDVFGGVNSTPIAKALRRSALDKNVLDGIGLVFRWADAADSEHGLRTECIALGSTSPNIKEASLHLQNTVVKMSTIFGFKLPAEFFLQPVEAFDGYYEKQILDCSNEWKDLLHKEDQFVPSSEMLRTGSSVLSRVPGCYVRLSPIALGIEGVTSSNAIHAMLLCAEGKEDKAVEYAKTYREGLRPPDGEDALLDLHTIALHVEPVFLNGMISLYAHGGKVGEPLKANGNWVYKTCAAVVSVKHLSENFFVMSCDMNSMLPEHTALVRFMDMHMKKSMDLWDRLFNQDDLRRVQSTSPAPSPTFLGSEFREMSREERFLLSAMGVDMNSQRMLIGEAITFLMQTGAPDALIQMLTTAGARMGLGASLSETYFKCYELMKGDQKKDELHAEEVCRLKRVADAAIILGANKKACRGLNETKPEKVRALMQVFSLKAGPSTKVADILTIPRTTSAARSLASAIYTAYSRRQEREMPHIEELQVVLKNYVDILAALGKCLHLCMVKPGTKKDAFVIVHGSSSRVSVHQVVDGGILEVCGEGRVFEAQDPCLLILKMKSDVECIVTPMLVA